MCKLKDEGGRCVACMLKSVSPAAHAHYKEMSECQKMLLTKNPERQLTDGETAVVTSAYKHHAGMLRDAINDSDAPDGVKEAALNVRRAIVQKFAFDSMAKGRTDVGIAITPGVTTRLKMAQDDYDRAKQGLSDAMDAKPVR